MPQRTPTLVRKRIVELDVEGYTTREIAEVFGLAESGVRRVKQRHRERGTVEPLPRAGGRRSPMTPDVAARVRDAVAARPDATRAELKAALGLAVGVQTLGRWLAKLGLPLKKSRSAPASRTGPTSRPVAQPGTRN